VTVVGRPADADDAHAAGSHDDGPHDDGPHLDHPHLDHPHLDHPHFHDHDGLPRHGGRHASILDAVGVNWW